MDCNTICAHSDYQGNGLPFSPLKLDAQVQCLEVKNFPHGSKTNVMRRDNSEYPKVKKFSHKMNDTP